MKTIDLHDLFAKGMSLHAITNTAYPLTPTSLKQYVIRDEDQITDFLKKEYDKIDTLSLYVHVPFCKSRCKFCEYVVTSGAENELKDEYTHAVLKEIDLYKNLFDADKRIVGFDIGGGTPTELELKHLEQITEKVSTSFHLDESLCWSIETTPYNAIKKADELKGILDLGFKRISMGVQTVNADLLKKMEREGGIRIYKDAVHNIRKAGFERFNIDLMYGFKEQSIDDFISTVNYTISLNPEYVTLYEMRYKLTRIASDALDVTLDKVNNQYQIAYTILTENGYRANYGKNTFSRIENDYGTSDYLTHRVIDATPYLGLGAGSQSFGLNYLAYNQGAANKRITQYIESVNSNRFPLQDIYSLPLQESMAKAISVMFYFGFIDLNAFQRRFEVKFIDVFKDEIEFLESKNLVKVDDEKFYVTKEGSNHLSGIIPMFYSDRSKLELMNIDITKILK